ncbi:hypothetical protein Tco_0712043 [Tanacetum coccineum]
MELNLLMGKMSTKIELALEQSQQGASDEVLHFTMMNGNPSSVNIKQHCRSLQDEAFQEKLFDSFQDEVKYEHVGPRVTRPQEGERFQDDKEMMYDC